MRRCGSLPEEVRLLAQKFHLLVRQHSKIVKEARQLTAKASANQMRKECHRDIHKFAHKILDKVNYTSIQPSLSWEQAEEYFSWVYSTTPNTFGHPEWMPECPQPSVPMPTALSWKKRSEGSSRASSPHLLPPTLTRSLTLSSRDACTAATLGSCTLLSWSSAGSSSWHQWLPEHNHTESLCRWSSWVHWCTTWSSSPSLRKLNRSTSPWHCAGWSALRTTL